MHKPYFKKLDGPEVLRARVSRVVRFEECDAVGIMWHGRYPSYFEDAREAMGSAYGISYLDFSAADTIVPIKTMYIDYVKPLFYRREYRVEAILHWSDAARVNIEYEIRDHAGETVTSGYSIQLMLDRSGNLLFDAPEFYKIFRMRWLNGEFT